MARAARTARTARTASTRSLVESFWSWKVVAVVVIVFVGVVVMYIAGTAVPVTIERFNRQYKVERKQKEYLVDQSDVKYYDDIERAFNDRLEFYVPVTTPVTTPVTVPRAPRAPRAPHIEPELNEYHVNHYVVRDYLNQDVLVDTQNVHDTVIQNNVKNKYRALTGTPGTPGTLVTKSIMDFCNNDQEISGILHKIQQRNATLVNFGGDTETQILAKTWDSANHAVKTQIVNEIRDCKSGDGGDGIYCPSGVATRIVSATYVDNPENYPKDKDSINKEILGKCAHLRSKDPDITSEKLHEAMVSEYSDMHDREFISHLMEPWLRYI